MVIREYQILESVGSEGGMGTVYRAVHLVLDQPRALKKLKPQILREESAIRRFKNEARTLARIDHPNIVKVFDFFQEGDEYYLVMEYVDGLSLQQYLKRRTLAEPDALTLFLQVLDAIDYAHQQQIIHRDIKPANILLTPQDTVKVVDFGLARMLDSARTTGTTSTYGSPWYMSPEQFNGHVDARSDIYALGITLFEMLTGEVPFDDNTPFKLARKHQEARMPALNNYRRGFSAALDAIIQKMTAKRAEHRYQSVAALVSDLHEYMNTIADQPRLSQSEMTRDIEEVARQVLAEVGESKVEVPNQNLPKADEPPPDTPRVDDSEKTHILSPPDEDATMIHPAPRPPIEDLGAQVDESITRTMLTPSPQAGQPMPEEPQVHYEPNVGGEYKKLLVLVIILIILLGSGYFLFKDMFSGADLEARAVGTDFHSTRISWNQIDDAEAYQLRRFPGGGENADIDIKLRSTLYSDTLLMPEAVYRYTVSALSSSDELLKQDIVDLQAPPIDFRLDTTVSRRSVLLSWAYQDQIKRYELFKVDGYGELELLYAGNATSYLDQRIQQGNRYEYYFTLTMANGLKTDIGPVRVQTLSPAETGSRTSTPIAQPRPQTKLPSITQPSGSSTTTKPEAIVNPVQTNSAGSQPFDSNTGDSIEPAVEATASAGLVSNNAETNAETEMETETILSDTEPDDPLPASPSTSNSSTPEAIFALGEAAFEGGDLADAQQHFVQIEPGATISESRKYYLPALKYRGLIELQQQNYTAALRHYLEALELQSNKADIYYYLGSTYQGLRQFNDAIRQYEKVYVYKNSLASSAARQIIFETDYAVVYCYYQLWQSANNEIDSEKIGDTCIRHGEHFLRKYRGSVHLDDFRTKFANVEIYVNNVLNN